MYDILSARRTLYALLIACFLIWALSVAVTVSAGPDDNLLDPSFGAGFGPDGSGVVQLGGATGANQAYYYDLAVAPDGTIVVGGVRNDQFWLARYTADGRLDPRFGGGERAVAFPAGIAFAHAIAVQADGAVVAGGSADNDFALARLLPTGALDPSFGQAGIVTTNYRTTAFGEKSDDAIADLDVLPDGRILAGGRVENCGSLLCNQDGQLAVFGYTRSGALDPRFADGGRATFNIDSADAAQEYLKRVLRTPNGKLVLVGHFYADEYKIGVTRLHSDGRDDATFAGDGHYAYTLSNADEVRDAALLDDGRVLLILANGALLRVDADGSGATLMKEDLPLYPMEMALQTTIVNGTPRQWIWLAGKAGGQAALVRLTGDGRLDASFNTSGIKLFPEFTSFNDLAVTPDGKILLLDNWKNLVRLLPDGSLDSGSGRALSDVSPGHDLITDLTIAADGMIMALGQSTMTVNGRSQSHITLGIYNPDGTLANTVYSPTGIVPLPVGVASAGTSVLVDDDGIIVAGSLCPTACTNRAWLVRRHSAFSPAPVATFDLTPGQDVAQDMALLNNRLTVVGYADKQPVVLRLDAATLARDPSFGANGQITLALPPQATSAAAHAVELQPDGKIVVVGSSYAGTPGSGKSFVARLLPDGALDASFGGGGIALLDLTPDANDWAAAVLVLPDGQIVVGGTATVDGRNQVALARLSAAGSRDRRFGVDGLATLDAAGNITATRLALLPDGTFLLAGTLENPGDPARGVLARFDRNGAPDRTFSADGLAEVEFGLPTTHLLALTTSNRNGDYQVYVGGLASAETGKGQFAIANVRYIGAGAYQAPIAADDRYTTRQDEPLTVARPGVLANDQGAGQHVLTALLVAPPANGSLELASDGGFTYTPAAGFSGVDTFVYRASDGIAGSDSVVASITVEPLAGNTPPVAGSDTFTLVQDGALEVAAPGVLANDADADGQALTAAMIDPPANGSLELEANGAFRYTPGAGFNGSDRFTYRVFDGLAYSPPTEVQLTVLPGNTNVAPLALNDAGWRTSMGEPLTVPAAAGVLANDSDANGDSLTAELRSLPAEAGTLELAPDGAFRYMPAPGYVGVFTFSYTASDGRLRSPATATISVFDPTTPTPEPDPAPNAEELYRVYLPLLRR